MIGKHCNETSCMRDFTILLIVIVFITGCLDKKIVITTEYIVNPNWSKKSEAAGANAIEIIKMKVRKDSVIYPSADLSQSEILEKLEYDSSFYFFANVKIKPQESYQTQKIFFNKENEFYWLLNDHGNSKSKVIGKLKTNSWYEISDLNYYSYVIYIDSMEKVHRYIINQANY